MEKTVYIIRIKNKRFLNVILFAPFQVALVYGQMNEPPGARARVALTGLTVAEYFRDEEGQDVLLFIDNIFRFTQAGSEVSTLHYIYIFDSQMLHSCFSDTCTLTLFSLGKERSAKCLY